MSSVDTTKKTDPVGDPTLFAERKRIHPQSISGRFRNIKWVLMALALGVYYITPFIRWDRGPNAPGQAVLIDFPARRFYFFFIEIWPQEFYYLTGLLVMAAMALFLMNAVAGRVWCGYLCPQTVWTDLFYAVERFFEGDRREQLIADKKPMNARLVARKAGKHLAWLMIAWWTGGAWVLYFADAPTLVKDLATFNAPAIAYIWIGILTLTTYVFAGFMREQVCTYMCPWPRIQAALTDEYALNVTYRIDRGEPRMSVKKSDAVRARGDRAGDCIDCGQCVAVCPTGIDIRDGLQLECIQCGLCIDACDAVMEKVDRPTGLIGYDTDMNIALREQGREPIYKVVRARTVIYAVLILAIGVGMLVSLLGRASLGVNVLHDRNPVFVRLSDGSIRNAYTVRLINKALEPRTLELVIEGLPQAKVEAIGATVTGPSMVSAEVGTDTTRELRVLVSAPASAKLSASTPIRFRVRDPRSGETGSTSDHFFGP